MTGVQHPMDWLAGELVLNSVVIILLHLPLVNLPCKLCIRGPQKRELDFTEYIDRWYDVLVLAC